MFPFQIEAAGYSVLNGVLSIIMLVLGFIIIVAAVKKWAQMWKDPSLRMERLYRARRTIENAEGGWQ